MGFPVSFAKGKRGKKLTWIGVQLEISPGQATAHITAEKVQELREFVGHCLSSNVASVKELRSFVGKAQNVAGVLHTWRPFLTNIWGALAEANSAKRGKAPPGCVWRSQVEGDLLCIRSFLEGTSGAITRRFTLDDYHGTGAAVSITTDASPWGI